MQVEFRYRFEAAHRFLKSDSKACMTPHGHTWYATLCLKFIGQQLNSSQMSVEFSEIKQDWKKLIENTFDHSFMHNMNDPLVEILRNEPVPSRLIPFPGDPTTELIAVFMFNKMNAMITYSAFKDLIKVEAITLEETPTNKITCARSFFESEMTHYQDFDGWWNKTALEDRSLRGN